MGHFTNLLGRALAFGATVLTDANTISVPPSRLLPLFTIIKHVIADNGGTAIARKWHLARCGDECILNLFSLVPQLVPNYRAPYTGAYSKQDRVTRLVALVDTNRVLLTYDSAML